MKGHSSAYDMGSLAPSLEALDRAIDGEVIVRGSPAYDQLPRPFNARFDDVLPLAVVRCASAEDVAQTISFIRRHRRRGLDSAARGGGHSFAGRSATRGIVIDVAPMSAVSVAHGVATVGAGARLGEVYQGLLAHGATIPGGSCPSVGVAGLTLGGGLGMLGRTHGVTSDHLVGARIVTADGQILECDDHHDAELFWALRGAGTGNFGVVTDLIFRAIPTPPAPVTVFHLTWAFSHAAAASVAQAWLGWVSEGGTAPDELAASLVFAASGNPDEPPSVEVFGTMLGAQSEAAHVLDELVARAKADPASSVSQEMSYLDSLRHWAARAGERLEDPRARPATRSYQVIKSEFFARPLPAEAVAAVLNGFTEARMVGQSRELDFSPWGGAYNRTRADATAFVHRDALYLLKHTAAIGVDSATDEKAAAHRWATRSWELVHPWGTGHVFPNFPDLDLEDWGHAYYGSNYERLLDVKARYDPDDLFHFQQSLPAR
jgi:FAD/FMN-containing dehydrogenase